jgi:hypothetical protein
MWPLISSLLQPATNTEWGAPVFMQAAGWREGQGLGREEQGRVNPIDAVRNPGSRGIGFDKSEVQRQQQQQQQQQQNAQQQRAGPQRNTLLVQSLIEKELAGKRHLLCLTCLS